MDSKYEPGIDMQVILEFLNMECLYYEREANLVARAKNALTQVGWRFDITLYGNRFELVAYNGLKDFDINANCAIKYTGGRQPTHSSWRMVVAESIKAFKRQMAK